MTSDTLAARGLRVKALIKAYWLLRSYSVHDDRCKLNKPPRFSGPCSCGLTEAIKAGEKAADLAEVAEDGPTALAASPEVAKLIAEMEGKVGALRDFVEDFAKAKIDALRYSPPHGSSPEDEPDPVVDAETVWAWQSDAKDALAAAGCDA